MPVKPTRIITFVSFIGLALAMVGCSSMPIFGSRPVVSHSGQSAARPIVAYTYGNGPTRPVVNAESLPACPAAAVQQANMLGTALMRVRLGMEKLQVGGILGNPAHAETFALTNGRAVEVFFYHTPDTICRKSALDDTLLPLVFQDDRLLGYGQGYYHNFIIPMLRTALSNMPENSRFNTDAVPSAKAWVPLSPAEALPATQKPATRLEEEDLPPRYAPPAGSPSGSNRQMGYTGGNTNQLGAGDPLR